MEYPYASSCVLRLYSYDSGLSSEISSDIVVLESVFGDKFFSVFVFGVIFLLRIAVYIRCIILFMVNRLNFFR